MISLIDIIDLIHIELDICVCVGCRCVLFHTYVIIGCTDVLYAACVTCYTVHGQSWTYLSHLVILKIPTKALAFDTEKNLVENLPRRVAVQER